MLYDEQYLYSISSVTAPYAYTQGQRLDLQTGETLPWNIPGETTNVLDVVNGQLVTCRILSDSPVPFPEDSEMSDAFLQNSLCEFDLTDAVTGKPVQKLLSYPWYGEDDGTMRTSYYYLGHNGSDLYFRAITRRMQPTNTAFPCFASAATAHRMRWILQRIGTALHSTLMLNCVGS